MGGDREYQNCPNHGLVLAVRKRWPSLFYWAFVLVTFGTFSPDYPYRCPRCGRLTERPEGQPL
jgi:hypothetical protein